MKVGFGAREERRRATDPLKRERGKRTTMAGADALLAHRVRVMRLYRHSLKQMMSWAIQKSLIYEEFKNIRSQFEANKNVVSTPSALTEPGGAAPEANPASFPSTPFARSNTLADGTRSCLRFPSRRAARTHARTADTRRSDTPRRGRRKVPRGEVPPGPIHRSLLLRRVLLPQKPSLPKGGESSPSLSLSHVVASHLTRSSFPSNRFPFTGISAERATRGRPRVLTRIG